MSGIGSEGVANRANTSDGFASGVVATSDPSLNFGLGVGGSGVVDQFHNVPPPPLVFDILMQDSGFVLLQNGGKIELE